MGRPLSHYCGKTRDGRFLLCQKTQRKRMIRKLKELRREMRRRMHQRLRDQHAWLCSVLRGHYAYFGISGNSTALGLPSSGDEGVAAGPAAAKPTAEALLGAVTTLSSRSSRYVFGRVHGWRQQMA